MLKGAKYPLTYNVTTLRTYMNLPSSPMHNVDNLLPGFPEMPEDFGGLLTGLVSAYKWGLCSIKIKILYIDQHKCSFRCKIRNYYTPPEYAYSCLNVSTGLVVPAL